MNHTNSQLDPAHNIARLFAEVANRSPDKLAIVPPSRSGLTPISFGQLWEQSGRVAGGLRRDGLRLGDRLIVMVPMSIDLYVILLALIRLGAVAVFVDPWMSLRRIAMFARYAEPAGFVGIPKSHLIRWAHPGLWSLRLTVSTGQNWLGLIARKTLDAYKSAANDEESLQTVALHDPALITFTSGSSGEPKGANRTHGFLLAQHAALAREFPYTPTDIDLPMFPVFALNNLVSGITTVVPDMDFRRVATVDGDVIWQQMQQHQVTTCTASPPLLDRLAATGKGPKLRLRRILTGGAPISDAQLVTWQEAFPQAEIVVAYGSTEAEPVADIEASQRLSLPRPRRGFCMGRPIAAIQTAILPIEKGIINSAAWQQSQLPGGEIGELVVCGDHVCQDYFRNEQATRENKLKDTLGKSWHRMGDTGYLDSEGRFWLVGRVHSTIRRQGTLIHPQLVEQVLMEKLPGINQVAAVGIADTSLGEALGVIAVPNASGVEPQEIVKVLTAAGYPCDRCLISQERLPVDPRHNSKIDYDQARKMIESASTDGNRAQNVSANAPFWQRWSAYSRERFPLVKHGILIACFYSSNHFLAQALGRPGEPLSYDLGSLLGILALLCFFFHLRVFDEHKDFADDLRHYPHRVLQRGVVTLAELRWLGGLAIGCQLLMSAVWRPLPVPGALLSVLIALGYSILMLKEFFVPEFLKKNFLCYAVSHLLIMPWLAMIVFSFTSGDYFWNAPGLFWLYACVGFFVTFNWEISRKIRAPEQEIPGVDSYTKLLGTRGAAWWVLAMRAIDTALVMIVGWYLQASIWFYLALVALFVGCLTGFYKYLQAQTPRTASQMETWAGLYIIAFDLILAFELVTRMGLRWEIIPQ